MKTKINIILSAGVLIILLPFTGFPESFKTFFSVLIGAILCWLGYVLYRQFVAKGPLSGTRVIKTESFVENRAIDVGQGAHDEQIQHEQARNGAIYGDGQGGTEEHSH